MEVHLHISPYSHKTNQLVTMNVYRLYPIHKLLMHIQVLFHNLLVSHNILIFLYLSKYHFFQVPLLDFGIQVLFHNLLIDDNTNQVGYKYMPHLFPHHLNLKHIYTFQLLLHIYLNLLNKHHILH